MQSAWTRRRHITGSGLRLPDRPLLPPDTGCARPHALSFGLGFQHAALCIAGVVSTPVIVIRAAGEGEPYPSWAVFAALAVSGLTTVLQALLFGLGSGTACRIRVVLSSYTPQPGDAGDWPVPRQSPMIHWIVGDI